MKEGEQYCDVCKGELRMIAVSADDEDLELCPICGVNFIRNDQTICDECQKKGATLDQVDRDETAQTSDQDWEQKVSEENDSIEDDVEVLSLSEIEESEDYDDDDEEDEDDPYSDDEAEDHDDFDFDEDEVEEEDDDDSESSDDEDDDDDLF